MARPNYDTTYRAEAIKAAGELHYGKAVIQKIEEAKDDQEIQRIMIKARYEKFNMNEEF